MTWYNKKTKGNETIDPVARALANSNKNKLDLIYRQPGSALKPKEQVFVVLIDGTTVNVINHTDATVSLPDVLTEENITAKGLTVGIPTDTGLGKQAVIEAWKTERTAWTVDDIADFTKGEPPLTDIGKRYLSTVAGKGSVNTALDFHKDSLYEVGADGKWREYVPKDNWTLNHKEHAWVYYDGAWYSKVLDVSAAHEHSRFNDNGVYLRWVSGKLYKSKKTQPMMDIRPEDLRTEEDRIAQRTFSNSWEEFVVTTTQNVVVEGSAAISDWKANTDINKNSLLRVMMGAHGTFPANIDVIIASNYGRTTKDAIDEKELGQEGANAKNNFSYIGQETVAQWWPEMFCVQGMKVKLNGFYGEINSTGKTGKDMTFQEQLRFQALATASTGVGRFIEQAGHGFDVGQWVTQTDNGYVLGQPDDLALLETAGRVSYVLGEDSFILESSGFGCDPFNTDDDNFWDYDVGTILYLAKDGGVTDIMPQGVACRQLCKIVEPGYALVEMKTIQPATFVPSFLTFPIDSELRKPISNGGFSSFVYSGVDEKSYKRGLYYNGNAGSSSTARISKPYRL